MNFLIPAKRLVETQHWVAFHHPQPAYPVHILIVSKDSYRSLLDLPAGDEDVTQEFIELLQELVRTELANATGYRVVVNGGEYQEVPVLHFHLLAEKSGEH